MIIVHKVESVNQQEESTKTLAHTTTYKLANQVYCAQRDKQGHTYGDVRLTYIEVYETYDELPDELQSQIEESRVGHTSARESMVDECMEILDNLTFDERTAVMDRLQKEFCS